MFSLASRQLRGRGFGMDKNFARASRPIIFWAPLYWRSWIRPCKYICKTKSYDKLSVLCPTLLLMPGTASELIQRPSFQVEGHQFTIKYFQTFEAQQHLSKRLLDLSSSNNTASILCSCLHHALRASQWSKYTKLWPLMPCGLFYFMKSRPSGHIKKLEDIACFCHHLTLPRTFHV